MSGDRIEEYESFLGKHKEDPEDYSYQTFRKYEKYSKATKTSNSLFPNLPFKAKNEKAHNTKRRVTFQNDNASNDDKFTSLLNYINSNVRDVEIKYRIDNAKREVEMLKEENKVLLAEVNQLEIQAQEHEQYLQASKNKSSISFKLEEAKRRKGELFEEWHQMQNRKEEIEKKLDAIRERRFAAEAERAELDRNEIGYMESLHVHSLTKNEKLVKFLNGFDRKLHEVEDHLSICTKRVKQKRESLNEQQQNFLDSYNIEFDNIDREITEIISKIKENPSISDLELKHNELKFENQSTIRMCRFFENEISRLQEGPCQEREEVDQIERDIIEMRESLTSDEKKLQIREIHQANEESKIRANFEELKARIEGCQSRAMHLAMRESAATKLLSIYDEASSAVFRNTV